MCVKKWIPQKNGFYSSNQFSIIKFETEEIEPTVEPQSENKDELNSDLKAEIKSVLLYMDQLLENLPEEKIMEFAKSEYFDVYKKLFKDLGLS